MGFENVNAIIRNWGDQSLKQAKSAGRAKNIRHREHSPSPNDSLEGMTVTYRKRASDVITAIVFNMQRTLFYVRNGAGRGYGGNKGSVWIDAHGDRKRTNPASLGKAGNPPREEKDFLKQVDETSVALIDEVALSTMDEIFSQAFNQ